MYSLRINNLDDIPEVDLDTDYIRDFNGNALEVLKKLSIDAKFSDVLVGPSIIRLEYTVESDTNLNKVKKSLDNIRLATGVSNINILAPVPEKTVIGIEFPRKDRVVIGLKDIVNGEEFNSSKIKLPICLGQNIVGENIIEDLASYPHLLMAGSTGSGKSICVNSIIVSLLYRFSPEELSLVLIDPKMVELSTYSGIKHLLFGEVADTTEKSIEQLEVLVKMMEDRYKLLQKKSVKNIEEYNEVSEEKIPYIVIVIDEFADLMLAAKKRVEDSISRIVAMARAVGMHMIVATQRPSVDVITGVIKANFPSRISCKVSSNMDSRTIIGQDGAEKLIGKGDMLIRTPNYPTPTRLQGTFISNFEIKKVVENIKEIAPDMRGSLEEKDIVSIDKKDLSVAGISRKVSMFLRDKGKVSSPTLQREFKISLEEAERILEAWKTVNL